MTAGSEGQVTFEEIAPLLGPVKQKGDWIMAMCPCHADGAKHNGSGGGESLGLSKAGVLKCFAGCEFSDVIRALRERSNIPSSVPTPIRAATPETLDRLYEYRDVAGELVAEKGRFNIGLGLKSFRWRKPGVEGWPKSSGLRVADLPMYGVERLAAATGVTVWLVEGEKACEACWAAGLLAVTFGGGAGQKDFGTGLEPLTGRDVVLWPDNDAPGRDFMALLQAKLSATAKSIRLVNVAALGLKEKDDAFDYFAAGHVAADIDSRSPNEPSIQITARDGVRVVVPSLVGLVTFDFTEMVKSSGDLQSEIAISLADGERPYAQRLNLLSASSVTTMRRDLDEVYGKGVGWARVVNTAIAVARTAYMEQDRGVDVFNISPNASELMLVPPLVVADGATIFFGDGGTNKSYLVHTLCWCMALDIPFAGFRPTGFRRVLYVDYEDSETNFRRRAERILGDLQPQLEEPPPYCLYYWSGDGIPLHDQVDSIRRKVERDGIGLIVIDSVAEACGGKPEDADVALRFFRALKRIGLPTILIAHVTKAMDAKKPFGSGFWHNEARRTWYVHRVQEEESDEIDVGLYCRKVNDGRYPLPISLHVGFDGTTGPVSVRVQTMESVPELMEAASARSQVWAVLERPMTVRQVMAESGLTYDAVETVFRRDREHFVKVGNLKEGRAVATLYSKATLRHDGASI